MVTGVYCSKNFPYPCHRAKRYTQKSIRFIFKKRNIFSLCFSFVFSDYSLPLVFLKLNGKKKNNVR